MSKEAMKLALKKIRAAQQCHPNAVMQLLCEADEALEEALAKQEQGEPVAKNENGSITWLVDNWPQNCLLYTTPQQPSTIVRTWVGLTEEDIEEAYKRAEKKEPYMGAVTRKGIAEAFEQILKEKNT